MKHLSVKKFVALTLAGLILSGSLNSYAMENNPHSRHPNIKTSLLSTKKEKTILQEMDDLTQSFRDLRDTFSKPNDSITESEKVHLLDLINGIITKISLLKITLGLKCLEAKETDHLDKYEAYKEICNIFQPENLSLFYNQNKIESPFNLPIGGFYSDALTHLKILKIIINETEGWNYEIVTRTFAYFINYSAGLRYSFYSLLC